MRHTLSCLVKNQPGVLARVSEAFASMGISIESVAVGETEDTDVSRATIVVAADQETVAEAERQCQAMDVVIRLEDLVSKETYARELLLVKVRVQPETITRIMQVAELAQARVIGLSDRTITLELAADHHAVDGMLRMLRIFGIVSLARSGTIAVTAGDEDIQEDEIEVRTPSNVWRTGEPGAS